jgi:hypothetical protein
MDQRAFEMTPDKTAAEKILAADFRNIIKKVKAGTPLSKSERDIVKHWEAEQPKPTPKASNAKSKQAVPPAKEAAQRIVESMQAAASLVGYRIEAIQAAKAAGCVAFKPGNRINLFELEEWFALHPEVTSVNQSDMTIAQALTMETVAKALTRRENYARMRRDLVRAEEMRHAGLCGVQGEAAFHRLECQPEACPGIGREHDRRGIADPIQDGAGRTAQEQVGRV